MMKKIVVAVDGTAGSGKSATLKQVAKAVDYEFIDTGLMYRAFTVLGIERKIDFHNQKAIIKLIPFFHYKVKNGRILLNDVDVSNKLTSPEVLANINHITAIPEIRDLMVKEQRAMVQNRNGGVIMIGRDITSVVLPHADLKIYLDASIQARANRRYQENPDLGNLDAIKESIAKRDASDKERSVGPLIQVSDAWYLDNSHLTLTETVNLIVAKIKQMEQN